MLAGCLSGRRLAGEVFSSSLAPEDFTGRHHAEVFAAAKCLYEDCGGVEIGALTQFVSTDASVCMVQALECDVSADEVPAMVQRLLAYSEAGKLISCAGRMVLEARDFKGQLDPLHELAAEMAGLVGHRASVHREADVPAAAGEVVAAAEHPEQALVGVIPTGLPDLDRLLWGGLNPGQLHILGARPGVGKSAVGLCWGDHALDLGRAVVWISAEMTARECLSRLVVRRSRVVRQAAGYTAGELAAIREAAEFYRQAPLTVWDKPISPEALFSLARRWRAQGRLDLLGVDYLQILRFERSRDKTHEQLSEGVMTLKRLAKELAVPVLLLVQCRRPVPTASKAGPTARLTMADFKGSGGIEEHSDVAMVMYPAAGLQLDVVKNRSGRTGTMRLVADWERMRVNCAAREVDGGQEGE